ncbi:hypothetical protein ACIQNU_05015 [Streptomyces sp. NPDC091292]|uniref:hypothetical protein n=1 Tax=Streptomyces sp. NPDC091292 TaxID=3365991 RepID=UPI00380B1615
MSHLWTTHRIRRKTHEPHTLLDILMNGDPPPATPKPRRRRKHPALIHVLATCLSTASLLAAVITAHTTQGR